MNISELSLLKTLCMYEAGNRIQIQIFTENKKKNKDWSEIGAECTLD